MDSSPRNRESGSLRTPDRRTPVEPLSPLDLGAWLRLQNVTRETQIATVKRDLRCRGGLPLEPASIHSQNARTAIDCASDRSPAQGLDSRPNSPADAGTASLTSPASHDERLARAAAYLAKIPPAVAGERGHDRTFHAACILVQGFDLTIDEARPLLHQWNPAASLPGRRPSSSTNCTTLFEPPTHAPGDISGTAIPASPASSCAAITPMAGPPVAPRHPLRIWENPPPPLPPHDRSAPTARKPTLTGLPNRFLMSVFVLQGGIGLRYWRDEFHSWDGTAYHAFPDGEIRATANALDCRGIRAVISTGLAGTGV